MSKDKFNSNALGFTLLAGEGGQFNKGSFITPETDNDVLRATREKQRKEDAHVQNMLSIYTGISDNTIRIYEAILDGSAKNIKKAESAIVVLEDEIVAIDNKVTSLQENIAENNIAMGLAPDSDPVEVLATFTKEKAQAIELIEPLKEETTELKQQLGQAIEALNGERAKLTEIKENNASTKSVMDGYESRHEFLRDRIPFLDILPGTETKIVTDNDGNPVFHNSDGKLYHLVDGKKEFYGPAETAEFRNRAWPKDGTPARYANETWEYNSPSSYVANLNEDRSTEIDLESAMKSLSRQNTVVSKSEAKIQEVQKNLEEKLETLTSLEGDIEKLNEQIKLAQENNTLSQDINKLMQERNNKVLEIGELKQNIQDELLLTKYIESDPDFIKRLETAVNNDNNKTIDKDEFKILTKGASDNVKNALGAHLKEQNIKDNNPNLVGFKTPAEESKIKLESSNEAAADITNNVIATTTLTPSPTLTTTPTGGV